MLQPKFPIDIALSVLALIALTIVEFIIAVGAAGSAPGFFSALLIALFVVFCAVQIYFRYWFNTARFNGADYACLLLGIFALLGFANNVSNVYAAEDGHLAEGEKQSLENATRAAVMYSARYCGKVQNSDPAYASIAEKCLSANKVVALLQVAPMPDAQILRKLQASLFGTDSSAAADYKASGDRFAFNAAPSPQQESIDYAEINFRIQLALRLKADRAQFADQNSTVAGLVALSNSDTFKILLTCLAANILFVKLGLILTKIRPKKCAADSTFEKCP